MRRADLLAGLAAEIAALPGDPYVRVAVDGVDGAGKTRFTDELAAQLRGRRAVVRASVDDFHRPRSERYQRGRRSPEGFYRDSFDLDALARELLDPFAPGGDGRHRRAVFDLAADVPDLAPEEQAPAGAVLLLDGIFLHRPGLRERWTWSIWLAVSTSVSVARCAARDGTSTDPLDTANRRYVLGQALYLAEDDPVSYATHVVDNDDLAHPVLVR